MRKVSGDTYTSSLFGKDCLAAQSTRCVRPRYPAGARPHFSPPHGLGAASIWERASHRVTSATDFSRSGVFQPSRKACRFPSAVSIAAGWKISKEIDCQRGMIYQTGLFFFFLFSQQFVFSSGKGFSGSAWKKNQKHPRAVHGVDLRCRCGCSALSPA